jgi:WD40-like Beta Propeller Repeat
MPTTIEPSPTRRSLPGAPPRDFDLEALIKEARRRQRKRQAVLVAASVAVGAIVWAVIHGIAGGSAATTGTAGGARSPGGAIVTTPFAVGATETPQEGSPMWGGLVVVRPPTGSCTRVSLPDSDGAVVFSGRRYAYHVGGDGSRVIAMGVVGHGPPTRFVPRFRAWGWPQPFSIDPIWVGRRLGLLESNAPRLHVGGRTIRFRVPAGARFAGVLAASQSGILYAADRWNAWGTAVTRSTVYLSARGTTRPVRGSAVGATGAFSPDGRRIALIESGTLWLLRADGTHLRRLTAASGYSLLWSPDGKRLTYTRGDAAQLFSIPADGGTPTRLTNDRGIKPLAWLGNRTLAVSRGDTLGLVDLDAPAVRSICALPGLAFGNATALG